LIETNALPPHARPPPVTKFECRAEGKQLRTGFKKHRCQQAQQKTIEPQDIKQKCEFKD